MASNATILKAVLHIADVDRQYYEDHVLTLARHPSETDERVMVRLLAFALYADGALSFGRGVAAEDEAALWKRDLTGRLEQWIEVGLPGERIIRQACRRAERVSVYAYGGRPADQWWKDQRAELERFDNLTVMNVPWTASRDLTQFVQRSMDLHCTIQEGQILIGDGAHALQLELVTWKERTTP